MIATCRAAWQLRRRDGLPGRGCRMDDEQQEVVAFLRDPASYPPGAAPVEIIETHASLVFLAGGLRLQAEARGQIRLSRFFHARAAACRLHRRTQAQPPHRAAALSRSAGDQPRSKTGAAVGRGQGGRDERGRSITSS